MTTLAGLLLDLPLRSACDRPRPLGQSAVCQSKVVRKEPGALRRRDQVRADKIGRRRREGASGLREKAGGWQDAAAAQAEPLLVAGP
jgi:hypothetical protein